MVLGPPPGLDRALQPANDLIKAITEPVNTAVFQEIHANAADEPQRPLPLSTVGVLRYVWEGKFGSMLIEVMGDKTFVNGKLVEAVGS